MNINKTKRVCAGLLIFMMTCNFLSPLPAKGDSTVTTSLIFDSGEPIIQAKWEMNAVKDAYGAYLGTDDATATGAQFTPSGQIDVNKTIAVCAIVSDPDGLTDIQQVKAQISYPRGVIINSSCGNTHSDIPLTKLTPAEGYEIFCNRIRPFSSNLPAFNTTPLAYSYEEICSSNGGEITSGSAAVFCGETNLSYADPSGNYKTTVIGKDSNGLEGVFENTFNYQDLTAFETDFSQMNYGVVELNTKKTLDGDEIWDADNQGKSTVRNVGNTRVDMKINQTDMGLGKYQDNWTVQFGSRIDGAASWTEYSPLTDARLQNTLELSTKKGVDFSININHTPVPQTQYTGTMTMSGLRVPHLMCAIPIP